MKFESKSKRDTWVNILLAFIPDLAIATLFAYFGENGIEEFFFVFLGLQAIYIAIWAKNSIWNWIIFKLKNREVISKAYLEGLRKYKYPEPEEYERSPSEFFENVALNSELDVDLRIRAAMEHAVLVYLATTGQLQNVLRITIACEDAIEEYKKSFSS